MTLPNTQDPISKTIQIGEINTLLVTRLINFGVVLRAEDEKEVLLPNRYVTDNMTLLSLVGVFVYTDSEDRLVATTQKPKAMLGEFNFFEVVDYRHYGSFVDWGLPKDLLVPLSEQKSHFSIGKSYLLRVCLDELTGRLYGSQRIGRWLENGFGKVSKYQKVDLFIIAKTPMGYKAIIDGKYEGMIFSSDVFEYIKEGDRKVGYIKNIRRDGKIDLSLRAMNAQLSDSQKILDELTTHKELAFTYKSDANEIQNRFQMSKKNFKSALTKLIEAKKIELTSSSIKLV